MSAKHKKMAERNRQKRRRDRRQSGPDWPVPSPFFVALFSSVAPAIEAAGSLDRAVEAGAIGGNREVVEVLRRLVPARLGGKVTDPNADADWQKVVDEAVAARHIDMEKMRQLIASM